MPSPAALEAFIDLIERGQTLESMRRFYAESAAVRENLGPPRSGKAALLQHEAKALASIQRMQARCVRPVLVSDEIAVIRWVFEIEDRQGATVRFEELAYQRWAGDLIVEEQFFYDPGQISPGLPGAARSP